MLWTPLSCWIVIAESEEVCCSHCNCMACLHETCTHVTAVLFYLKAAAWLCTWQTNKQVWIEECRITTCEKHWFHICWKEEMKSWCSNRCRRWSTNMQPKDVWTKNPMCPSGSDLDTLHNDLSSAGTRPAILVLTSSHSSFQVDCFLLFPNPYLHSLEYIAMEYHVLLKACESVENYCYETNDDCCWEINQKSVKL